MQPAFDLFGELTPADADALFSIADEWQVISETRLIEEGKHPSALYVVLEGLVAAVTGDAGGIRLGEFGPGEILGEVSFLEARPAAATVIAVESSLLLAIPRRPLASLLESRADFAARFYRALALCSSRRLLAQSAKLGELLEGGRGQEILASTDAWARLSAALEQLKARLRDADRAALANDGRVPDALRAEVLSGFRGFVSLLDAGIGDASGLPDYARKAIGSRVQSELLPYLLLSECAERFYSKPRGYAGDFHSIELMYRNRPSGVGRLGPLVDECFLNEPPTVAARNRRALLSNEIASEVAARPEGPVRIASLASGPAAEVFDAFAALADPGRLEAHLVDIDLQALAFVADRRDRSGLRKAIELHNSNLVYLAMGRRTLDLPPQHLVYSVGLIDYFSDPFVIKLLDYVHELLAPGGRVILGNFHPRNSTRALMDHVLDWPLVHRDESDMNRLFAQSRFGRPCSRILFEEQRINLFAEGIRG